MTPEQKWHKDRVQASFDQFIEDAFYQGRPHYTAADIGVKGGDHSAFVKYWVDEHGNMHVEDIRTEEVYERPEPHFTRTWPRPILAEASVIQANRPHACPVRETRYFTMCHDGMRRHKVTRKWQTCEICQGFGFIE